MLRRNVLSSENQLVQLKDVLERKRVTGRRPVKKRTVVIVHLLTDSTTI